MLQFVLFVRAGTLSCTIFPTKKLGGSEPLTKSQGSFFGQSAEDLEKMLGFHTYQARYVSTLPPDTQMSLQPELGAVDMQHVLPFLHDSCGCMSRRQNLLQALFHGVCVHTLRSTNLFLLLELCVST